MESEKVDKILKEVDVLIEDPGFFPKIFASVARLKKPERKDRAGETLLFQEEYEELSSYVDQSGIQDSSSVRNALIVRSLVGVLIGEDGKLNTEIIPPIIESLKQHMYSLGPNRQYDAKRNEHILNALQLLVENKQLQRQIRTIGKPYMHRQAEVVIRQTLYLPSKTVITDAHARQAALSAWLCYLRQNVGSCFATAPAIIVHDEQPLVFFKDIQEMLSTGRLKRTFGGIEYAVPFSYSWGAGDLRRGCLFQKGGGQEDLDLWKSPGLLAAFEKTGLVEPDLSTLEKIKVSKKLITDTINNWQSESHTFFATVEQLLRKILLAKLQLTESDIKEYESRPKGTIHGGLLMAPPLSKSSGTGVGGRCAQFFHLFEEAKDAFKMLADNALLKTWEFTLASFAETKSQFTSWNLYSSLGLKPDDEGGIGPKLYEILKRRLDECNEKVRQLQVDYEQAYNYLQHLQRKLQRASSEEEARWIKIELQTKSSEFRSLEELRNTFHNKARRYSLLYDGLIDLYYRLFPNYFQEVYDPDIIEVTPGPYDDSPAGFRLFYKHGRDNTSQWTLITNHKEFIDALASFFTATEQEISTAAETKGLEDDLAEIVTSIVSHVRSEEFLNTAFWRMAEAHRSPKIKDPLKNLDKIQKKPWVYTSGGALNTLLSCYFCLEDQPKEVSQWIESPTELIVFFIDAVKEIPQRAMDEFLENPEKSLIVHSPTHAFLLKPGYPHFVQAWQSKQFTYTWVRDEVITPMEIFVSKIFLDDDRMRFVIDNLLPLIPTNFKPYFKDSFYQLGGSMQVTDFRAHILDTIELSRGLQLGGQGVLTQDQLDSVLYSLLPLFPSYKLKERAETIVSQLDGITGKQQKKLLQLIEEISGRIGSEKTISAKGLQEIIKAMITLVIFETSSAIDYPLKIAQIAQKEGFALPTPFLFADTNWVKDHFAFTVNPGNGKFELWRMDYTGSFGHPMSDWKHWLNGTKKKPEWGVFNRPHQYRA